MAGLHLNGSGKHEYCQRQFDEQGISTRKKIEERPVLISMLETLRKGDTLVVYKLNRLARAGRELVVIWDDLTKKGINLVSLYEKGVDEMMIHAYAMIGQAERRNIRESTISGLNRKKSKMEKVGSCLYGYKTDPTKIQMHQPDCHSYKKPYLLIKDTLEQEQVKVMIDCRKSGFSYGNICKFLEKRGYKNRNGNSINKSTIYRVLKRLKINHTFPTPEAVSLSH